MPARPRKVLLVKSLVVGLAILAPGALAGSAKADGLPVLGVDVGSKGVAAGSSRYVTLPSSTGATIVARTAVGSGRVLGFTRLRGNFTIPAVAYDGSASGLSADGSRLALIQPRLDFPRSETAFAILDAKRLRLTKLITLRGDYSFDAISPRGQTLFLIEYISAADPTRYHVRAYDLRSGRLLPSAVVDPHERGEAMRGSPLTRATSPGGRWAFTLYDGAGDTPFVHALDTSRRRARCIDLPMLAGRQDLSQLRLSLAPDGSKLGVGTAETTLALVDTRRDFRVSVPPESAAPKPAPSSDRGWLLLGGLALATILGACTFSVALHPRPRRAHAGTPGTGA